MIISDHTVEMYLSDDTVRQCGSWAGAHGE